MAAFGFFRIKIPFTATDLSKPLPVNSGAMINDGTPYPDFTGVTTFSISGDNHSFRLVALYDRNMVRLPALTSTPYEGGGWEGFFLVERVNTIFNDFGLSCGTVPPEDYVAGNSQPCIVKDAPPPPVPTGHRIVVKTDPTKVAVDGGLVWKDDTPEAVHFVEIRTGKVSTISVDDVIQWAG